MYIAYDSMNHSQGDDFFYEKEDVLLIYFKSLYVVIVLVYMVNINWSLYTNLNNFS